MINDLHAAILVNASHHIHQDTDRLNSNGVAACLTVILGLAGRAVAVYGCCAAFAGTKQRVTLVQQNLLVWGGLRGALALALALGLPAGLPQRDTAISVTFAVVAFSIIVQGLTMTPLLRHYGELGPRRTESSH